MRYDFHNISTEKFLSFKKLITENGGIIYPDGKFEVSGVHGGYMYDKNTKELNLIIVFKPYFASWGMVEARLNSFFA